MENITFKAWKIMKFCGHTIHKSTVLFFLILMILSQVPVFADENSLIMGVFPRRPAQITIQSFTPLAEYLSEKLKRKVKLETTYDFASFWQGVKDKKYDIVHYNQYHYIRSHKEYGYNVISMNEEFGKSTISSLILAKKESDIMSLEDIPGNTFAFGGGPKAMVSYILPVFTLRNAGISSYQFKSIFAKNPPNALMTVYFDKADLAGVGKNVIDMSVVKNTIDTTKLHTIAESESIVQLPWAVKNSLSLDLSLQIQHILTTLNTNENSRKILKSAKVTNIIPAEDSDYDRTREIVFQVLGMQY